MFFATKTPNDGKGGRERQTESGRHEKEARLAVISSESVKTLPSIGLKTDLVRALVLAERLVL